MISNWFIIAYLVVAVILIVEVCRLKPKLTFFLVPLLLASCIGYVYTIRDEFGYPVPHTYLDTETKYLVVAHAVQEPKYIFLWLYDQITNKHRLVQLPYVRNDHKELEDNKSRPKYFSLKKGNKSNQIQKGSREQQQKERDTMPDYDISPGEPHLPPKR